MGVQIARSRTNKKKITTDEHSQGEADWSNMGGFRAWSRMTPNEAGLSVFICVHLWFPFLA
jgi:hypothetical protein